MPAYSARPAVANHTVPIAGATRRCSVTPPGALMVRPLRYPRRLSRACHRSSRRARVRPAPLLVPALVRRAVPRRAQESTVTDSAAGVRIYTVGASIPTRVDHGGPYRAADRQRTDYWWLAMPAAYPEGPLSGCLTGPSAQSP